MSITVQTHGFDALDAALAQFTKASARNILKRAAIEALEPMAEEMRQGAPEAAVGGGRLKDAIAVSDKLGPRQKKAARRAAGGAGSFVEVHAGVADVGGKHLPSGVQQEFGNENHGPQPFVRPAWEKEKMDTLDRLRVAIADEIAKATARAQRRAANASRRAARAASAPAPIIQSVVP
ncbi:MAG: hypothetical protein ACK4JY_03735 [Brevundimonas sp.]|uniref:hypothetical protein n=1 Tax=Brevundimonas sp. TaxID=1871086 RepID=UPI00391BDBBE